MTAYDLITAIRDVDMIELCDVLPPSDGGLSIVDKIMNARYLIREMLADF